MRDRPWLTGAAFTMGDIALGIMAHWWYSFPIDHFELPHMQAWHVRPLRRPAFQTSVAGPDEHAA